MIKCKQCLSLFTSAINIGSATYTRTLIQPFIVTATTQQRHISLKPKLKEFVHCDYVDTMDYGIYALTTGYIKESAIEAGRLAITRKAKTKQVWKIVCESPFTKKPLGTRMGKGKGKVNYWAGKAIAGQVIYEFNCENISLALEAFKQVKAKLPVRLHFRVKPKVARTWLSGDELLELIEKDKERKKRLSEEDDDDDEDYQNL